MTLSTQDCRLVSEFVVGCYNDLEHEFREVQNHLPILSTEEKYVSLREELFKVERLMRRERYRVGFLGLSQVGKSTTLNNALGDHVVPIGSGGPCTSTIIRMRFVSGAERPVCILRYMTPTQFEQRREAIGKMLALFEEGTDKTDQELLSELERLLSVEPAELEKKSPDATEMHADREFFARLLRSRNDFGSQYLQDPVREERTAYATFEEFRAGLREFASHPDSERSSSRYLLLQEVELLVPTEELSDKLELIDLPGWGAKLAADDELTKSFMSELDGALVFQSTENVKTNAVYRLLSLLAGQFGKMAGRVWMIVTRFDGLAPHLVHGNEQGKTILDTLSTTLNEKRVPHEQVLLVSNTFHERLREEGGSPTRALYTERLSLELSEDGQPMVPDGFRRHPQLCDAYQAVMKDGGIARVRDVVKTIMADEVHRQVAADVAHRLREITKRLSGLIADARDRNEMGLDDFERALAWSGVVRRVAERIGSERTLLGDPAAALRGELFEVLDKACPQDNLLEQEDLPEHHRSAAYLLTQRGRMHAKTEGGTLRQVYGNMLGHLREISARLAPAGKGPDTTPLPKAVDPFESLDAACEQDLEDRDWYECDFDSFESKDLFPDDTTNPLSPHEYRQMLERKIDAVVCHVIHRIGNRARLRLELLERRLRDMGDPNRSADQVESDEVFDRVIHSLDELHLRLTRA